MTRNDAFINAHAKAYEGLPDGVVFNLFVFNLWESNVDLQSENTPELAKALGVEFDKDDESNVEIALHNRAMAIFRELLNHVDEDDEEEVYTFTE